jgi:hypothetical protein
MIQALMQIAVISSMLKFKELTVEDAEQELSGIVVNHEVWTVVVRAIPLERWAPLRSVDGQTYVQTLFKGFIWEAKGSVNERGEVTEFDENTIKPLGLDEVDKAIAAINVNPN